MSKRGREAHKSENHSTSVPLLFTTTFLYYSIRELANTLHLSHTKAITATTTITTTTALLQSLSASSSSSNSVDVKTGTLEYNRKRKGEEEK